MHNVEKIINYIIIGLEKLFEWLFGLLNKIPEGNKGFTGRFGSESSLFSSKNKGFNLTGTACLSMSDAHKGALICGTTGTGKSVSVIIPTIMSTHASCIVHDPAKELLKATGGYKKQQGYTIEVLDYTNPISGFNPLTRANTESEIQKLASSLIENSYGSGKAKDPFWSNMAITLLYIIISIVKRQEPEFQNLYNVRYILNKLSTKADAGAVDELFKDAPEALYSEYASFISNSDNVVTGVISSAKSALQIFSDPAVAKTTSFDTMDFESYRTKKKILYIQNSVSDSSYYSQLTAIFFSQFFSFLLSKIPTEKDNDVMLLIDEMSSIKIKGLETAVVNIRKFRGAIMLLMQDYNQLVNLYGKADAETIRANLFAKLYFPGQSLETCRELEAILGKHEYVDDDGKKQVRPLLTADEIRKLKNDEALIVCSNYEPILAKMKPYFKRTDYRNASLITPPEIESQAPSGPVPLLPLTKPHHEEVA